MRIELWVLAPITMRIGHDPRVADLIIAAGVTGDLNEVKQSFQASMNDLRDDVRLATATMGEVRDTVIVIASKISPDKPVPPARRRSTSKPGG